ncbi:NADP-dependent alcohol dehydrogenase 6 [Cadophora sp. MPI-SDFR-AT-0126]|nr:NADP-dependent alcohol dehydrogenase 6 [Leotiomycetes sp. MPI-SDFR-AT-0126]
MVYPETFQGFMVDSHSQWSTFNKTEFKPKAFEPKDVDVEIEACGVCGSDVHTLTGGWGQANFPLCVGHEVVGHVVNVGKKVTSTKVGDRVGVGAQVWACLECKVCKSGQENYCPHQVDTYNARYPNGDNAQGGYSSHIRVHEYFVFKIPDNIPSELAAPMMCAGLTSYSPLVRAGCGPGKKVAILGIGGLGHFGILFAAALGAETYAISHSPRKKSDAIRLGAKEFICTNDAGWAEPWAYTFDFILNTADMTSEFNLKDYMSTLAVNGTFHHVGLPDKPLPEMRAQDFCPNGAAMSGSHIGNRTEAIAMLSLASERNIKSWVETIDISQEGCKEAVERVKKNDVKYRFTLVNYQKAFKE